MARVAKRGGEQQKKVEEALPKVAKCIRDHLSIDPEKKNAFAVGKANARRTKPGLWADITKADRLRLANSAIRRLTYQDKREPDFTKIPSAKTAGEFQCARYYYRLIIKIRELSAYIDTVDAGCAASLHASIFEEWEQFKSTLHTES